MLRRRSTLHPFGQLTRHWSAKPTGERALAGEQKRKSRAPWFASPKNGENRNETSHFSLCGASEIEQTESLCPFGMHCCPRNRPFCGRISELWKVTTDTQFPSILQLELPFDCPNARHRSTAAVSQVPEANNSDFVTRTRFGCLRTDVSLAVWKQSRCETEATR